jgi:hypothetical protein
MECKLNGRDISKIKSERRSFIKKALYVTPSVIILGSIVKPTKANAFDSAPSDPETEE